MPATLKQLDPTRVELEIAIPPEDLEAARGVAFRELAKNAKVPGFRPGHIPRAVFEKHYGRAAIEERALDDVVPRAYSKALEEHDLYPLANPDLEFLPAEGEDGQLKLKAVVTVRPEIALGDYKGIELTEESQTAADEDVERSMETIRRDAATLMPVSRAVQLGDVATLDYEGKVDGEPFEGGKAEQAPTEIEEGRFVPGFIEGIIGMQAGETKDNPVTFPADYPNADLAGKDAVFTVTVHETKERELPELNDDLAARITGRPMTLLELKIDLRRRLDSIAAQKARRAMTVELIEKLLAAHDFPLPAVLIEREIDALVEDARNYVARAGREWSDYLTESGKTEDEIRDGFREEAERRVKTSLLLSAIAKAEGIEATEADVDHELDALAEQYRQPKEKIMELLRPNLGSLIAGIVRTKTIDALIDAAKIVPAAEAPATAEAPA